MKNPSSIFNEVLGPIYYGPSSSHTAAPGRIGKAARTILGEDICSAKLLFDPESSYAAVYKAQASDRGFITGLLNIDINDPQALRAFELAGELGVSVEFVVEELANKHPNYALIRMTGISGQNLSVGSISTGGGNYEIADVDGLPTEITGDNNYYLIQSSRPDEVLAFLYKNGGFSKDDIQKAEKDGVFLLTARTVKAIDNTILQAVANLPGVVWCKYVEALFPILACGNTKMPFLTATQALVYARRLNLSVGEVAIHYESARSGKNESQIIELAKEYAHAMEDTVQKGLDYAENKKMYKAFDLSAATLQSNATAFSPFIGILSDACIRATAAMECLNLHGCIVASPTGGACGVLPATVLPLGKQTGKSEEKIARALLVAGIVGVFISHQATFGGEVGACQAEIGSGSAMAAAGLVDLMDGTIDQAFDAASLALQNMLGSVCDPVGGVGVVPCIARNSMGAANAYICAHMIMAGFPSYISLDDSIKAMMDVGNRLPASLRCTSCAGLAVTDSGREFAKKIQM